MSGEYISTDDTLCFAKTTVVAQTKHHSPVKLYIYFGLVSSSPLHIQRSKVSREKTIGIITIRPYCG